MAPPHRINVKKTKKGMSMMRFSSITLIVALAVIVAATASADQPELIDRLKSGGHILMIRHARAPGSGDPPHLKIGDCSTQRNLDDAGRSQARDIGAWLRANGIRSARMYSSQWCRCLETARLIGLGAVQELVGLNSFYERPQDREPHLKALNHFISQQPAEGELIILVTHFVTIAAMAGTSVASGEGVVLALQADAPYTVVGLLDFGR
jgi:phosphohistidine phosphatase SixA